MLHCSGFPALKEFEHYFAINYCNRDEVWKKLRKGLIESDKKSRFFHPSVNELLRVVRNSQSEMFQGILNKCHEIFDALWSVCPKGQPPPIIPMRLLHELIDLFMNVQETELSKKEFRHACVLLNAFLTSTKNRKDPAVVTQDFCSKLNLKVSITSVIDLLLYSMKNKVCNRKSILVRTENFGGADLMPFILNIFQCYGLEYLGEDGVVQYIFPENVTHLESSSDLGIDIVMKLLAMCYCNDVDEDK